jgi:hypothetical protein
MASYIAEVSAFFFSGRFMRIKRTGPSSVTMTWSVMKFPQYSAVIPAERSESRDPSCPPNGRGVMGPGSRDANAWQTRVNALKASLAG